MHRKNITRTVLVAAAAAAALSVGALAASGAIRIPFLIGGAFTQGTDQTGTGCSRVALIISEPVLEDRDGRLCLTAEDGQALDLTGLFSQTDAYVYSYQDADGYIHNVVVGGTAENYGCFEFLYDAEGVYHGGGGTFPSGYSEASVPDWLAVYKQANGIPAFWQPSGAWAETGGEAGFRSTQPQWLEKGVTLQDGRVLVTVDGEILDITRQFSPERAYVYTAEGADAAGFRHILLMGGTPENIGTADYAYTDGGGWSMSSSFYPAEQGIPANK